MSSSDDLPVTRTQSVSHQDHSQFSYLKCNSKVSKTGEEDTYHYTSSLENANNDPKTLSPAEMVPPDGGRGWIVVISGFLMLMFSIGVPNSFGEYQTYYTTTLFPHEPTSNISWIGTLQYAFTNLFGIVVGILCERMDTRLVTFIGGVIMGLALVIASFIKVVWGLILTQGVLFGIGSAFCFIPPCSLPSQWFTKKRGLAIGLVVAGSGVGGIWVTPTVHAMINSIGYAWALRISGILIFAINTSVCWFMRPFFPPQKRDTIIDFTALKDIRFVIIFTSAMFGTSAYFSPFFYLPRYAMVLGGRSRSFGTKMIMSINAASVVGRVLTGFIADRLGKINMLVCCTTIAALSIFVLWLPFHASGTMIAMTIIYGLFCGGFISLLPVVIAELFGVARISNVIGLLYIANFCGSLIGPPSMGAILDNIGHDTNFVPIIVFAGSFMAAAAAFQVILRFIVTRNPFAKV